MDRIECPCRTLEPVAFRQIFRSTSTKGCPLTLFCCWLLRHLDRIVQQLLPPMDVIEKKRVHKVANGNAKRFSLAEFLVGERKGLDICSHTESVTQESAACLLGEQAIEGVRQLVQVMLVGIGEKMTD